jgi:hypothetical protein
MAEDQSGAATVSNIVDALQDNIATVTSTFDEYLSAFISRSTRREWAQSLSSFSKRRPYLTSFLLSQLIICGLPMMFLICTAITCAAMTAVFLATVAGFFFMLGGLLFTVFVVLPVLFFSFGAALLVWAWIAVGIWVFRWWTSDREDERLKNEKAWQRAQGRHQHGESPPPSTANTLSPQKTPEGSESLE